jgi:hypothetical protein
MSSYTMQLREYIENATQDQDTLSIRDRIEAGRTKLFDFDYPIFDPDYKKVLETHFIRKFYMREIGFETEGLFKFQLETWLLINMPYFNKLFESELIKFDPLVNSRTDVTHTTKKDKTQNQQATSSATGTSNGQLSDQSFDRQLESNNPDSRLTITSQNGEGVIEYASSIQENSANGTKQSSSTDQSQVDQSANATINETEDFVQSRVGKIGVQSYSKMLNEYRDSLLRIENKMFSEMQELFMLVY